MALFAFGGTTYGRAEETLAFYVLLIPVLIAAGYDAVLTVILLGAGVGVIGSTINVFSTVIASEASGLTSADRLALRLIFLVVCWRVLVALVMRYVARVKVGPSKSLVIDSKAANEAHFLGGRTTGVTASFGLHRIVLVLFARNFGMMIWGVSNKGSWMAVMSGLFLIAALVIGIIARLARGAAGGSFCQRRAICWA